MGCYGLSNTKTKSARSPTLRSTTLEIFWDPASAKLLQSVSGVHTRPGLTATTDLRTQNSLYHNPRRSSSCPSTCLFTRRCIALDTAWQAAVGLTSSPPPATTSRRSVYASPAATLDDGASLHVKVENLHASSASEDPSSVPASSGAGSGASVGRPLTLADLERVLELRGNRMEYKMAERETKMCKLLACLFAKPPVDPSPELYRRLQNASSIDELLPALEGQVVDGPHPAAVAGEKAAEAFAERTRADLLQHNLCEAAKEIAALREAAATSNALARSLKEEAARLIDSSNEGQLSMQLLDTERKSFLAEKQLLEATIRDKDRLIATQVDDYRRTAGNRQLLIGRCYEHSTQLAQLSDAILMGDGSAHQWLKRQLADKDHKIRTLTRCKKFTSLVSEFQKQSPFLAVAAMLGQPMPGLEANQLDAFRDASNLLRQAGLGVFGEVEQHVQTPSPTPTAPPPNRPVRSSARATTRASTSSRTPSSSRVRSRSPSQATPTADRRLRARSSSSPFAGFSSFGEQSLTLTIAYDEPAQSTEAPASSSSPTSPKKPKKRRMARWARIQEARQAELAKQGSAPAPKKQRSSNKKRRSPSPASEGSLTEEKAPVPAAAEHSTGLVDSIPSPSSRYPQRAAKLNATVIQWEVHAQESDNDSEEAVTSGVTEEVGETLEDPVAVESSPGGFTATPVVGEASPATQVEAASTLASLSSEAPPALTTSSVMIRVLSPGKHPAWSPGSPDEDDDAGDSDSDRDVGSAGGSPATTSPNLSGQPVAPPGKPVVGSESNDGGQQQASPADHGDEDESFAQLALTSTKDSTGKAPVKPAGPSKKVPVKAASAPASKKNKSSAKVVKSAKPATRSSSSAAKTPVGESKPEVVRVKLEGFGAGLFFSGHFPISQKTLVQRASNATSRDSRESKYIKRLRSLPFFHKASRR
ncbi:hypothetical protein PHYSODRAFT_330519 [Phytophthora sojae]|uniref:Uncharacterized protein n=1 Tax=Phytophthora sojae (strain P6497) TaxID=1094619 RepID=G4ZCE9_PHYSP|nr:hypothetical protein PHYSODRAFT_330519 [Phytophthora sojae]EGZ16442.1 hypothetical protein PHYSODRAFT_330519 [Phytophthora sojae]|eukprot:XP_009525500.1 hypothetical protein PHYSODRAFT_330519 [Phytophthora sojae]